MSARVKLPDPLDKLLRSELETAIHEAALHRDDELTRLQTRECTMGSCVKSGLYKTYPPSEMGAGFIS